MNTRSCRFHVGGVKRNAVGNDAAADAGLKYPGCFPPQVEEGWWSGSCSGKSGVFPSNFVKELDSAGEQESNSTAADEAGKTAAETGAMLCVYSEGIQEQSTQQVPGSVRLKHSYKKHFPRWNAVQSLLIRCIFYLFQMLDV